MEAARHHALVLNFFACLPKLRMNLLFAKNIPLISQDFFAASFGGIQLDEIWELRERWAFAYFWLVPKLMKGPESLRGEMGSVGPGLQQAAA